MNALNGAYGAPNTPLPEKPLRQWAPDISAAYLLCCREEAAAAQRGSRPDAVLIRILGYLLRFCPPLGLASLAMEINSSTGNHERLVSLGQYWKDAFLGVWKRNHSTPAPASHPTRGSVTITADAVSQLLTAGPIDYTQSKRLALTRHANCCAFSGMYDLKAPEWDAAKHPRRAQLELCQVWPQALVRFEDRDTVEHDDKLAWNGTCLAVLSRFMGDNAADDVLHHFNGDNVHDLRNVFIATKELHGLFDGMYICLEARAEANMYMLKQVVGGTLDHQLIDKILDMNSPYPNIPAVSPEFLALHRACAIVAHLSGAGELLEKEERDREPDNRHELPAGGGKQSREWDLFQYRLTSISVQ